MFFNEHKKTTLCDWSVRCDVMLQAVEASRDLVVKNDALLTLLFAYQSSLDTYEVSVCSVTKDTNK